jgi:hypothetical protein
MGWMDESLDVIKVVCQSAGGIHEARYDPANHLSPRSYLSTLLLSIPTVTSYMMTYLAALAKLYSPNPSPHP